MAHILNVIPKKFRLGKRIQNLNCIKDCSESIRLRLEQAAKAKQRLEFDVFERENRIKLSKEAANKI